MSPDYMTGFREMLSKKQKRKMADARLQNSQQQVKGRVKGTGQEVTLTYLVWRKGMGRDTHRKGSKVLLCFRQWGQVKEDLRGQRTEIKV
jgi:hypothetical protein